MLADSERITWLASFPKSGNTWVRCLLQAYRTNGYLDINDLHTALGDSAVCYTRCISPIPLKDLGDRGAWLVRPAALLNALMSKTVPRIFKTHYANITIPGLPSFIPPEFTQRAIYVVRDPRSVLGSLSKFYSLSIPKAIEQMANKGFWVGTKDTQTAQVISSWSNHVRSWASEKRYPIHFVKYEDLLEDPLKELKDLIEFMGIEFDEARGKRAVKAANLSKLRKAEQEKGFSEYDKTERGTFFNEGGTRWKEEIGPKYIEQIEKDHGEVMKELGYALEYCSAFTFRAC